MDFVEKRLTQRAKRGDREAFAELIEIYKDKIFQLAYRMVGNREDAEDIAQETFLRVYANLHAYDESYKFSTWIYRIATNLCIDRGRKKRPTFRSTRKWSPGRAWIGIRGCRPTRRGRRTKW